MNNQAIEKQDLQAKTLQVNSIFYTIQGEGPFAGRPAIFIRLAGCNLQCPLCDTEYTGRIETRIGEIEDQISKILSERVELGAALGNKPNNKFLVVITGGEPFRQNLSGLVRMLLEIGAQVQIETNGTLYQNLPYSSITVICSPKTGNLNKELLPHISAFKYVLQAGDIADDGLPIHALGHPNSGLVYRPAKDDPRPVYVQPADQQKMVSNSFNLQVTVKSAMRHNYIFCLQVHKTIGVE
jgi:7-carboxy-7-deazaguanine synthase